MSNSTDYEKVQNHAQKLALQKQDILIEQNELIIYHLMRINGDIKEEK